MTLATISLKENHSRTRPSLRRAPADVLPEPEYVDCKGLRAGFGIKPGLAYQLLASGDIKAVSLKRRGAKRGKRLFNVESVRAFLRKQAQSDTETAWVVAE